MLLFFFQDLGSSLLSLLWILFQLDCLSPIHLVVLLRFYLVPLSGTYSSADSFCLTFCDCGFHSIGCRVVVLLGFCCLPPGGWDWCKGLVQASWWEGLVSAHLWVELGLVPLVGRALSRGVFNGQLWAQEDLRQPVCWWVELCSHPDACLTWGLPALEPTGWWLGPGLGEKMAASRSTCTNEYSPELPPPVSSSPQWAKVAPPPPTSRRPSNTSR